MLHPFFSRATLIFVSGAIAVGSVGCSTNKPRTSILRNQQSVVTDDVAIVPSPVTPTAKPNIPAPTDLPSSPLEPSSFELGLDKAAGATSISQSAQSPDDWYLVASQYHDAIALMQKVERQSPEFAIAQTKIAEFETQMKYAIRQANTAATPSPQSVAVASPQVRVVATRSSVPPAKTTVKPESKFTIPVPPPGTTELAPERASFPVSAAITPEKVYVAPIKRRVGGTPVVTVTFNGQQQFDMIVDTGASGTVITQAMADALGVIPVGKAKANTASSKGVEFPIGYVDSMTLGGVRVNRVPVAIAGAELETGLLGHDFFGNYDVTIKRNVVEFRPQSHSDASSGGIQLNVPTLSRQYQPVGSP
ncbi:MAG: retropepsin-like aspartic protease family protein [Trichormus sp.]